MKSRWEITQLFFISKLLTLSYTAISKKMLQRTLTFFVIIDNESKGNTFIYYKEILLELN